MPIYARDIWIVLRSRDIASGTIRSVGRDFLLLGKRATDADKNLYKMGQRLEGAGKAATTAGIGLAAAGVAGLLGIKNLTSAAQEFERQAALAATQVHNGRVSVQELEQISIRTARVIPVPIRELNAALYDIFSSTDIKVKDSEKVLRSFSRAAVAGQDNIVNVGRTAISILNAWDMPIKNLTHIFDVQFKMVQLGVGTYKQFANVLGRAIPSVRAAGQSFEFLAGTMAFLTRRGQSAAQAAVSIARLTDLFRRPAAFKGLAELGKLAVGVADSIGKKLDPAARKALMGISINALDARGKLRPINELLTEMAPAFARLNVPERAGLFKALFGGEGTIQARRFFDLAINNTKQLNQFIKDVGNSAGSTTQAYNRMANTLAAKSQLLSNNWQILKIQLGNALIPMVTKFVERLTKLVQWFQNLSPHTKVLITRFMVWGSILATVGGVLLAFLGIILLLVGGILMLAAAIGGPASIAIGLFIGLVAALIISVALLAFVIIKYHKQIWAFMVRIWNDISTFVIRIWRDITAFAVRIWNDVADFFASIWKEIASTAASVWRSIATFFSSIWKAIASAAQDAWNVILTILKVAWRVIRVAFAVFLALILLPWQVLWGIMGDSVKASWNVIYRFLRTIWNAIANFFKQQWADAVKLWNQTMTFFKNYWNIAWTVIKSVGTAAWNFLVAALNRFLITPFRTAWTATLNALKTAWNVSWEFIKTIGSAAWRWLAAQVNRFLITPFKAAWNGFLNILKSVWNTSWGAVKTAASAVWDFLKKEVQRRLVNPFLGIWRSFVSTLGSIWEGIKNIFIAPVNWVISNVINRFINTLNSLSKKFGVALNIPTVNLLGVAGKEGRTGKVQSGRQRGGRVAGMGIGDVVPAMLEPGEFVVRKRAVAAVGADQLEAINQMQTGGLVGKVASIGSAILGAITNPGGVAKRLLTALLNSLLSGAGHFGSAGRLVAGGAKLLGINLIDHFIRGLIPSGGGRGRGGLPIGGTVPTGSIQQMAMRLLVAHGWGSQWGSFNALEMGEAGWNPFARNASSGAYGLAQALPPSKYPPAAFSSNPLTAAWAQLQWMMNYIGGRYGSPAAAYSAWLSRSPHWYAKGGIVRNMDRGGYLMPGLNTVWNGTGRPEPVGSRVGTPSPGGGDTYITVNTQEINPRHHAMVLAWELNMLTR